MNDTATAMVHEPHESSVLERRATSLSPEQLREQIAYEKEMRNVLRDYVKSELKPGHHFANKLGTVELEKPMLLQEGTRNICSLFKLVFGPPQIDEKFLEDDHYRVRTYIELFNAEGLRIATGTGICSTRESKYAYRKAERMCPSCNQPAIIKDNFDGGGWLCWGKKGGCGEKFPKGSEAIESQVLGRVENPDIADIENTVIKMSIKRAKSQAICDVPLVSELFVPGEDDQDDRPQAKQSKQSTQTARQRTAPAAGSNGGGQSSEKRGTAKAVELYDKLVKFGVDHESLVMQFLPEGVASFADLTDEQANDAIEPMVELLNSTLASKR